MILIACVPCGIVATDMGDEVEFKAFPKIPRLRGAGVVVTEKIDGTNALVHVAETGEVRAGSRTRWVTPEADNFGWAKWVAEREAELRLLGPGYHYGEWWGSGIQRGYGCPPGERHFSLFNVHRWNPDHMPPPCCSVVPVLGGCDLSDVDQFLDLLRERGSVAMPGFRNPEGVVVFHPQSKSLFKVVLSGGAEKRAG